jgi:hypothetical protein
MLPQSILASVKDHKKSLVMENAFNVGLRHITLATESDKAGDTTKYVVSPTVSNLQCSPLLYVGD